MLNDSLLTAPRASLSSARARLAQNLVALERARDACAGANDRIRALDDEDTRRASAYAERCEQAAVDGVPAVPYLESAPDAAERHRAMIELRGAEQAVTALQKACADAEADLMSADLALRNAIDAVLDARSCELIETAERHLAALEQIGAQLAELLPDTRFAIGPGLGSEPAARAMLKRLSSMPRSDIDVPIHELRGGGPRLSRLDELRAELMADAAEQPEHQAAA